MNTSFTKAGGRRWPVLLIVALLALGATACEGLVTGAAQDALQNGREIRDLEDQELLPVERELEDLYADEILPRERELEDLWDEARQIEQNASGSVWDDFQDPWSPGGAAYALQQEFEGRFRKINQDYRLIELENREMQLEAQGMFGPASINKAVLAKQDRRYEIQRELDRLQRFGYQPIEDVYNEINRVGMSGGRFDNEVAARAEELNRQIQNLYEKAANSQQGSDSYAREREDALNALQHELSSLHENGRFPIEQIYDEITRLQSTIRAEVVETAVDESLFDQIQALELERDGLWAQMDAETAGLYAQLEELLAHQSGSDGSIEADIDHVLAQIADLEAQFSVLLSTVTIVETSAVDTTALEQQLAGLRQQVADAEAARDAELAGFDAQLAESGAEVTAVTDSYGTQIVALETQLADLRAQLSELASDADGYDLLHAQVDALEAYIAALQMQETDEIAVLHAQETVISADRDASSQAHEAEIAALLAQISDVEQQIAEAVESVESTVTPDTSAADTSALEAEITELRARLAGLEAERDADGEGSGTDTSGIEQQIADVEAHWQGLIDELTSRIESMAAQLGSASTSEVAPDPTLDRITSLELQAQQLDSDFLTRVQRLESKINAIIREIEQYRSGSQGATDGLYEEIERLNSELEKLHNATANSGSELSRQMDEMQQRALTMQENLQRQIRELEELLWKIDDEINDVYRSGERDSFTVQIEFEKKMKELELRRFKLDDLRWELEEEEQTAFVEFENIGFELEQKAQELRVEKLTPIYDRINVLEDELSALRDRERELEDELRAAGRRVDERRRELEDEVFDLLERAVSGTPSSSNGLELPVDGLIDAEPVTTEATE